MQSKKYTKIKKLNKLVYLTATSNTKVFKDQRLCLNKCNKLMIERINRKF